MSAAHARGLRGALGLVVVLGLVGIDRPASGQSLAAAAPVAQGSAEFVLVNNTSVWLSLYIDGQRSVSVAPGDRGVDIVRVGFHRFEVVTLDGTDRRCTRSGEVGPEGKSWTIDEN